MNSWNNGNPEDLERREGLSAQPDLEIIARRAYQIWQSHDCPEGTATDDWRQAEAEIWRAASSCSGRRDQPHRPRPALWDAMIDEASEESFPASDPPASTCCTIT